MNSDLTQSIADNIKKYRTLNHLTQEKMAEKLELDTQYYSQLERAERKFTIEKIGKVCETFDIEIGDIIEIRKKNLNNSNHEIADSLINEIENRLQKLSLRQLQILLKYIEEIIPLLQ